MRLEAIRLGRTGRTITRLGMGGCPLGGYGWGECSDDDARRAVQAAFDAGVNFFDTADVYGFGHSERLLAEALGDGRKQIVLATKFGVRWDENGKTSKDISPRYAREALEGSLKRLKIDHIPLYYIHWPDGATPIEETVAALDVFRREGKIGGIGVSNFSADEIKRACAVADIDAAQVQFSLLDQEKARGIFDVVREQKITLVTWGSLAQGLLTGKYDAHSHFAEGDRRNRYENFQGEKFRRNLQVVEKLKRIADKIDKTPAQIAIRWLLETDPVGAVLFGAKNLNQVDDNLGANGWRLPEECRNYLS